MEIKLVYQPEGLFACHSFSEEVMADILLSILVSGMKEKLMNPVLQQFGAMWGIEEELKKLERALIGIQFVLEDAEERQVKNDPVKRWLAELKKAASDADGVLDEFDYEALRHEAKIQDHMTNKVLDFFSLHNPALFRLILGKKIQDTVKNIDKIMVWGAQFGFRKKAQPQIEDRPQTHSYVDETEVIGRKKDKEKIVQLLLNQRENEKVTVLPIVGMGGLGKTTLAQQVYGDQRVKEHFKRLMWICVSDDFKVAKLVRSILDSVVEAEVRSILDSVAEAEKNLSNMDLLQQRLRDKLSGKRFLLVLDDVWNEDPEKWEALNTLLGSGGEGRAIMVTTRSGKVSDIMGTLGPYYLSCLSEDDSWSLFSRTAFKSGAEERPELIRIGKKIAEKCGGLPLAVKTLGSLMRTKKEEREWWTVLSSEIWDIKDAEDRILEVLKLSYSHLSPHSKQCFAFCSIFPKDYEMEKDMLIQLWMANGFIPSKGRVEPEILGQEIFDELIWRSFFQDRREVGADYISIQSAKPRTTRCKMHDLMHDLAQSIMGSDCTVLREYAHLQGLPDNIRHLFMQGPCQLDIHRTLNKYPTIFTLLLPKVHLNTRSAHLSKARSLKALDLQRANFIELPLKIGLLKHLRYLDLSYNNIRELPEATCELFHLLTLKLNHCRNLHKLPEAMRNMRSLRHLYLYGCYNLKHMPGGIGQLSSLQTLTKYIVGDYAERGIRELKGLNLSGDLELYNLEKVRGMEDATEANLASKQNIQSLVLCWGVSRLDHEMREVYYEDEEAELNAKEAELNAKEAEFNAEDAEKVLAGLQPHSALRRLVVRWYAGLRFPVWMMDGPLLQHLVQIHLGYCRQCENLPPLWQMPRLKILYLHKMNSIKYLQSSGYESTVQPFPLLKELTLSEMQSLESWWGEEGGDTAPSCFPQLVNLKIIDCPNLMTMSMLPSLRVLQIKGSNKIPLKSILSHTTLSFLEIETSGANTSGGTWLPSFPRESISFRHMKSLGCLTIRGSEELRPLLEREDETTGFSSTLQYLSLKNCNWLFSRQLSLSPLEIWTNLTSLRYLQIFKCNALVSWPQEELRGLISLKSLHVFGCQNLTGISPTPESLSSASGEGVLAPYLETLYIFLCKNLMELPRLPTSLKTLRISDCPNLKALTDQLGYLPTLEDLHISGCSSLTSLPEGTQGFTSLQHLRIEGCPQLTSLPQALQQRLRCLQTLVIEGCPDLERRCTKGEYRHLVSGMPAPQIGMRRSEEPSFLCRSSCLDCFSPE